CDPQTLARDLAALCGHGYSIDFVEGLDLFPQTYHFETVVRLRRG
ncbi:MAG: methyltransferase, TrmA family, partial [Acidobacteria bacterium]|nr:methyltransferase, TrmA family [Acidobacteriota bacterium]